MYARQIEFHHWVDVPVLQLEEFPGHRTWQVQTPEPAKLEVLARVTDSWKFPLH